MLRSNILKQIEFSTLSSPRLRKNAIIFYDIKLQEEFRKWIL